MMYFTTSSGRIELKITLKQAWNCSHPGPCDMDVKALAAEPSIHRQLTKLDHSLLKSELREYGAWNDDELSDHEANLMRILWVACGDIVDQKA